MTPQKGVIILAKKRMFSVTIIEHDTFLDMPLSTQALYLHLSMNADDYGFVSPRRVMRMVGATEDDLKLLFTKRYILGFESGVVVIKHWHVNNTVRKDRSNPTTYDKELKTLTNNEFGAYTEISRIPEVVKKAAINSAISQDLDDEYTTKSHEETEADNQVTANGQPNDNQWLPQIRLDKIRVDKNRVLDKSNTRPAEKQPPVKTKEIDDLFSLWEAEVGYTVTARKKMNREYASKIIKEYPAEDVKPMLKVVSLSQDDQYAPRVSDFIQLYRKWDDLKAWVRRKKAGDATGRPRSFKI